MELQSIAEGVETETVATMLEDMGVNCLQGFLIARPMPVDQIPTWLERLHGQEAAVVGTGVGVAAAGGKARDASMANEVSIADSSGQFDCAGFPSGPACDVPRLSRRQREVMQLLAEGCSVKVMARRLELGIGTVKAHLAQAYMVLGAHNRIDAVRRAGMMQAPTDQERSPAC
jgi:DNA-binding CsgD family transcriptional regulator